MILEIAPARSLAVNLAAIRETHDLTCLHDLEGRLLDVNHAVVQAIGCPRERLLSLSLRDLVVPEVRDQVEHYLEQIRAHGRAEGLISVVNARGERRVWQYQNCLVEGEDDLPVVQGLAHDVTDHEAALSALRRSERHLRSIIEHASDVMAVIGTDGALQFFTLSTTRLLGRSEEELEGASLFDFVHAEDLPALRGFLRQREDGVHSSETSIFRLRHADGTWRWVSAAANPIHRRGQPGSLVINARDITEQRQLEAQLAQANRMSSLGKLAATVAHEFNNVLMGIQPFADLMQRPNVPPETVARGARHIANSIIRGKRVALDILRFTNPPKPSFRPIDVGTWWSDLAPEMQASVGDQIKLSMKIAGRPVMLADVAQISQVFSNLITNARDAMPGGGSLRLSARRVRPGETLSFACVPNPERFIYLSVTDTGSGMEPDVLQHAFEPLFTTKQSGGTGLGLAVAHQAVKAHGGCIVAESQVGVGTTFHIFLPAADEGVATPEISEEIDRRLLPARVLVVDDEHAIIDGIAELLRSNGIEVDVAGTGAEALRIFDRSPIDLALIDISLPDMNGFEVAGALRAHAPDLPVLFSSGHGAAEAARFRDARTSFIQKPFEIAALLEAMVALKERSAV